MEPGLKYREPKVSIVIAVHNDEEFVGRAVESALSQTENNIEVICVDDASTDATLTVIERYITDNRLKIIRLEANRSAYQARRYGIEATRAPYVLFLDGDDELVSTAAEVALAKAWKFSADVVGFGVEMVMPPGQGTPRFERSLQPNHSELSGNQIVSALFPLGRPAQGHLWRYLFSIELLRHAYAGVDESSSFYRANDIPVSFLALSAAQKYVSTTNRLYRYFFRRGTSGQAIHSVDEFTFYLKAIDSIESIRERVPAHARASFRSARRSMISNLVRDCLERTVGSLQVDCFDLLTNRVGALDVILAAADFCREALPLLVSRFAHLEAPTVEEARAAVVTTSHLKTGGLQGVVAAQIHYMVGEGINVTLALHQRELIDRPITTEANLAEIVGSSWAERIQSLIDICTAAEADVVIDHHILYNEYWPFYSLAAKAVGIGTIGWVHNFALRPMFDGSSQLSFLIANMPTLESAVVLSPTDVTFWSLNGAQNVVYLPNPPSPDLINRGAAVAPKKLQTPPIELVWWGRLQQSTKQVTELLKVAKHLQLLDVEFHMTIIGPDGPDMTRSSLHREAERIHVSDSVDIVGPLYGDDLTSALQQADICLMTSAIEGYPLTLVEGQALGLPTVMYEMPWLAYLADNAGARVVPQKDAQQMAAEIAGFVESPITYERASAAAVYSAQKVFELDFGSLYRKLIEKRIEAEYTPAPTAESYTTLLRLSVEYSERTARSLANARAETTSIEKKLAATSHRSWTPEMSLPTIENFQHYRKKQPSFLRQLLAKVLPSTWRQANINAERQAKWNHTALSSIARQQQELARSLHGLQQAVNTSTEVSSEMKHLLRQASEPEAKD